MNIKSELKNPSTRPRQPSIAILLFLGALAFAIAIRMIGLGQLPLSDHEATLGFQALHIFSSGAQNPTEQALYQNLTGILFFLFGASNFTARVIPAFFGGALAFSPFLFRKRMGTRNAVILSFILALEPCLLSFSRQADSTVIALTLFAYAMGFILNDRFLAAGICTGMMLLSGSTIWFGIIGVVLALLWKKLSDQGLKAPAHKAESWKVNRPGFVRLLIALLVTYALISSVFFIRPSGMVGPVSDFLAFLKMWKFNYTSWPWSSLFMGIVLLVYELFLLIFGAIGLAVRKSQDKSLFGTMWRSLVVISVLTLLGPLLKPLNPSWFVAVFCYFASVGVGYILRIPRKDRGPFFIKIFIDAVLLVFAWLNYLWLLSNFAAQADQVTPRILAIFLSLAILAILLVLYVLGWNWQISSLGLGWAVLIMVGIMTLSMARRAAGFGENTTLEPYRSDANIADITPLERTFSDLLFRNALIKKNQGIAVIGQPGDSLKWVLKEFGQTHYFEALPPNLSDAFVVTFGQDEPILAASYTGQSFDWYAIPDWRNFTVLDWLKWASLQKGPVQYSEIIVWARTDLFPTGP
jgi:hypothetical protein